MLVRRGDILKGRWVPAPLCPVTKASAAFAQFSSGFLDHGAGLLNILNILVQRELRIVQVGSLAKGFLASATN